MEPGLVLLIVVIVTVGVIGQVKWSGYLRSKEALERETATSRANSMLAKIFIHFNTPTKGLNKLKNLKVVKYNDENFSVAKIAYLWMEESDLNFVIFDMNSIINETFSVTEEVNYERIKYDDIYFFFNSGEFYTENQVSGGGGGGVSLTGTLVGGALLGGVGAVIGSRKKVDPITSQLLVHDTRETIIKYDKNGTEQFIHFELDNMKILYSLIPQKSFDLVFSDEIRKSQQKQSNTDELSEKLRKLKQLREEGLLTELEYENKRMSIIDNI